jgi:hypothetical protein
LGSTDCDSRLHTPTPKIATAGTRWRNGTISLNINVQLLFRHTDHWQDPADIGNPSTRFLALQETIAANQLAPNMGGASTRINYTAFNHTRRRTRRSDLANGRSTRRRCIGVSSSEK